MRRKTILTAKKFSPITENTLRKSKQIRSFDWLSQTMSSFFVIAYRKIIIKYYISTRHDQYYHKLKHDYWPGIKNVYDTNKLESTWFIIKYKCIHVHTRAFVFKYYNLYFRHVIFSIYQRLF